jgi:hypothetical protein
MTTTRDLIDNSAILALREEYRRINGLHAGGRDRQAGLWAPLYEQLYNRLTDATTGQPKPGVDPQTWLWLRGARFVNAGTGPFAALIRDYTIIQTRLRYGPERTATPDEMNQASNEIARAFLGQWLGFDEFGNDRGAEAGIQPTIKETGLFDAGPAASRVFNRESVDGDPAGWAGTLLMGNLGEPAFWRDLVLKSLRDPTKKGEILGLEPTKDIGSYNAIAAAAAMEKWISESLPPLLVGLLLRPDLQEIGEILDTIGLQRQYSTVVQTMKSETDSSFAELYGLDDGSPKLGSDLFRIFSPSTTWQSILSQVARTPFHYTVGSTEDDIIGYTKAKNGAFATETLFLTDWLGTKIGDVINAGRGNDTVHGTSGSDILDGGEGNDELVYLPRDWRGPFSTINISFDVGGKFDSRVIVEKTSLIQDSRDIGVNFEKLTLDYGKRSVIDTSSPSGRREQSDGSSDALKVEIDLTGTVEKQGSQLKREETVRVSGDFEDDDGISAIIDLGLGDDVVDFSGLTRASNGKEGLQFKNVEKVILSRFDDNMRLKFDNPLVNQRSRRAATNDAATGDFDDKLKSIKGGEGNDNIVIQGGEFVTVAGGLGRDWIYNRSNGGVIYGDSESGYYEKPVIGPDGKPVLNADGTPKTIPTQVEDSAENSDNIWYSPNTVMKDAQRSDVLKFYGLTLTGGDANGGVAGLTLFGGIGAAVGMANLHSSLDKSGRYDAARSIYFDHLFPWMTYAFRPNKDSGGMDMYVTNQFEFLFNAVFGGTANEAYKKAAGTGRQGHSQRLHEDRECLCSCQRLRRRAGAAGQ